MVQRSHFWEPHGSSGDCRTRLTRTAATRSIGSCRPEHVMLRRGRSSGAWIAWSWKPRASDLRVLPRRISCEGGPLTPPDAACSPQKDAARPVLGPAGVERVVAPIRKWFRS